MMHDPSIDPNDRTTWPEPEPDPDFCFECLVHVPEGEVRWCEECPTILAALCPEHAVRKSDGTVLCRRHAGKVA